jgi:cytochrome P450
MAPKRIQAPGPAGHPLLGNSGDFYKNQLGFLTECAQKFGDVVKLRFLHVPVFLLSHPKDIESVFTSRDFIKPLSLRLPLQKRIFGKGLLSSSGANWLRQRRVIEGAFRHDRLPRYATEMFDCTNRMLSNWRPGETRDVYEDLRLLALEIAAQTLFNVTTARDVLIVRKACDTATEVLSLQSGPIRLLDNVLPTRNHFRFGRAIAQLDRVTYDLISKAQSAEGPERNDLLSILMNARGEDGMQLDPRQLRDHLTTLLFASQEAVALALTWCCYLLARHPDIQTKLAQDESAAPGYRAQGDMAYSRKVVLETLRLYPPNRSVGREALKDSEIGGYHVPAGAQILMSQWVVHRDARYFENPAHFEPERWTGEFIRSLPRFAFFPFGGGARICVGQEFAIMETALVMTAIAQKFKWELADGQAIQPRPEALLRPSSGVRMRLSARHP